MYSRVYFFVFSIYSYKYFPKKWRLIQTWYLDLHAQDPDPQEPSVWVLPQNSLVPHWKYQVLLPDLLQALLTRQNIKNMENIWYQLRQCIHRQISRFFSFLHFIGCLRTLHQSYLTVSGGTANWPILGELGSSLHLLRGKLGSNMPGYGSPRTWDLHSQHNRNCSSARPPACISIHLSDMLFGAILQGCMVELV